MLGTARSLAVMTEAQVSEVSGLMTCGLEILRDPSRKFLHELRGRDTLALAEGRRELGSGRDDRVSSIAQRSDGRRRYSPLGPSRHAPKGRGDFEWAAVCRP